VRQRAVAQSRATAGVSAARPIAGAADYEQHVEALVARGVLSRVEVARVVRFWHARLRGRKIGLPGGGRAFVTENQMYHVVIRDPRLRARPERMERLLQGAYEARAAQAGQVLLESRWRERGHTRFGYAVLERGGMVITMHYVDRAGLDALLRRHPELLWRT